MTKQPNPLTWEGKYTLLREAYNKNRDALVQAEADIDVLLAVATIYVEAFSEEEVMTLPEKLQLQNVEAILARRGKRY
jgi:hypothetical protein